MKQIIIIFKKAVYLLDILKRIIYWCYIIIGILLSLSEAMDMSLVNYGRGSYYLIMSVILFLWLTNRNIDTFWRGFLILGFMFGSMVFVPQLLVFFLFLLGSGNHHSEIIESKKHIQLLVVFILCILPILRCLKIIICNELNCNRFEDDI